MKKVKSIRMDPAHTIITYLGGDAHVANILGVSRSCVFCLSLPRVQGGADGIIDYRKMLILLAYAKNHGIDLRQNDFLNAARLRRILNAYDKDVEISCCVCGGPCTFPIHISRAPWMAKNRKKRIQNGCGEGRSEEIESGFNPVTAID